MCNFKSFIYSLEKDIFVDKSHMDSHSQLAELSNCNDDKVIKIELVIAKGKESKEWKFKIDTLPIINLGLEEEKVYYCFNVLMASYIMRKLHEFKLEGIQRGFIHNKSTIMEEYKEEYKRLKDINDDAITSYNEALKACNNNSTLDNYIRILKDLKTNKRELKTLQEAKETNNRILSEARKEKEIAYNNFITFEKAHSIVTLDLKELTMEDLQEQIDQEFTRHYITNKQK